MGVAPIAVPQGLAQVLNSAGDKSNVDFDYLLQTAMRESSLNPEAKAATSSAVGLFQFLESTWLQVVKEQGPRLGYGQYADAITRDANGDYTVKNKALRKEILALREDPQMAADMAAAFTQANGDYLQSKFGKMPSAGELYIAHFMGPQGAEKLFRAGLQDPTQIAAKLFPRQAKANPALFYSGGQPRSIEQLYRTLVAKHVGPSSSVAAIADDPKFTAQQLASPEGRWSSEALPSRFSKNDMSFTSFFSTDAPRPTAEPLIATDALQSLVAPEISDPLLSAYAPEAPLTLDQPALDLGLGLGFVPLPAPAPLVAPGEPQPVAAALDLLPVASNEAAPRARVLMTRQPGNSAFLTQLIDQN